MGLFKEYEEIPLCYRVPFDHLPYPMFHCRKCHRFKESFNSRESTDLTYKEIVSNRRYYVYESICPDCYKEEVRNYENINDEINIKEIKLYVKKLKKGDV